MNNEKIIAVLIDIMQAEMPYSVEKLVEDEGFKEYGEIVLAGTYLTETMRTLIQKHGYQPVNDVIRLIAGKETERRNIAQLTAELRSGFDKDPASAARELERMCDLCAQAADALEELV